MDTLRHKSSFSFSINGSTSSSLGRQWKFTHRALWICAAVSSSIKIGLEIGSTGLGSGIVANSASGIESSKLRSSLDRICSSYSRWLCMRLRRCFERILSENSEVVWMRKNGILSQSFEVVSSFERSRNNKSACKLRGHFYSGPGSYILLDGGAIALRDLMVLELTEAFVRQHTWYALLIPRKLDTGEVSLRTRWPHGILVPERSSFYLQGLRTGTSIQLDVGLPPGWFGRGSSRVRMIMGLY